MITRHFGVSHHGLVGTGDPEQVTASGVRPLRQFWSRIRMKMLAKAAVESNLTPAERRKRFRVVEGGKA